VNLQDVLQLQARRGQGGQNLIATTNRRHMNTRWKR
jgi:hypothetical protein